MATGATVGFLIKTGAARGSQWSIPSAFTPHVANPGGKQHPHRIS